MLEQGLEATGPVRQPAVASALCRSELFEHREVIPLVFLAPALVALAFVPSLFFSAIRTSFHHGTFGTHTRSFRRLPGAGR